MRDNGRQRCGLCRRFAGLLPQSICLIPSVSPDHRIREQRALARTSFDGPRDRSLPGAPIAPHAPSDALPPAIDPGDNGCRERFSSSSGTERGCVEATADLTALSTGPSMSLSRTQTRKVRRSGSSRDGSHPRGRGPLAPARTGFEPRAHQIGTPVLAVRRIGNRKGLTFHWLSRHINRGPCGCRQLGLSSVL